MVAKTAGFYMTRAMCPRGQGKACPAGAALHVEEEERGTGEARKWDQRDRREKRERSGGLVLLTDICLRLLFGTTADQIF